MVTSRYWTGSRLFGEAITDLQVPLGDEVHSQKLILVNRAIGDVIDNFYPVMVSSYMTKATLNTPPSGGKYSISGTGSWDAANKKLTHAGMSDNFASGDVGKLLLFRVSNSIYVSFVESVIDIYIVKLSGFSLPDTNQTVASVMMAGSIPSGDSVDISNLKIMRSEVARVSLESSNLSYPAKPLSYDDFLGFRSSDYRNLSRIGYTIEGNNLLLKKGSDIQYGTLTLHYPEIPPELSSLDDFIPIPDGPAVSIVLSRLKILISRRVGSQANLENELSSQIQALYNSYQVTLSQEENKEKVQALS